MMMMNHGDDVDALSHVCVYDVHVLLPRLMAPKFAWPKLPQKRNFSDMDSLIDNVDQQCVTDLFSTALCFLFNVLSTYLSIDLSTMKMSNPSNTTTKIEPIHLFINLSIYLSMYLSIIYLPIYRCLGVGLFFPQTAFSFRKQLFFPQTAPFKKEMPPR